RVGRIGARLLQGAPAHVAVDDEFARRTVAVRNGLAHAGDFPGLGDAQVARVQVQLALQQGEQRGLARAVLAHDAQALAGIDDEFGVFQQHLDAAPQRDSSCAYHGASCSRVSSRIWSSAVSVLSHTGSSSGKAARKLSYSWPISSTRTPLCARK